MRQLSLVSATCARVASMVVPHSPRQGVRPQRSRLAVASEPIELNDTSAPSIDLPDSLSSMVPAKAGDAPTKQGSRLPAAEAPQTESVGNDVSTRTAADTISRAHHTSVMGAFRTDQADTVHTSNPTLNSTSSSSQHDTISSCSTVHLPPPRGISQLAATVDLSCGWGGLATRTLPLTAAAACQAPSPWAAAAATLAQIAADGPGTRVVPPSSQKTQACLSSISAGGSSWSSGGAPAAVPVSSGRALAHSAYALGAVLQLNAALASHGGAAALSRLVAGGSQMGILTAPSHLGFISSISNSRAVAASAPSNSGLAAWQAQQFRQLSQLPLQLLEHSSSLRQKLAQAGREQQQLWQTSSIQARQPVTAVDDLVFHQKKPIEPSPLLPAPGNNPEQVSSSWTQRTLYQHQQTAAAAASAVLNDFLIR